jgi:hypothetical protein
VEKILEGSIHAQLFNKLPHIQQKRKQVYLIKVDEMDVTKKMYYNGENCIQNFKLGT